MVDPHLHQKFAAQPPDKLSEAQLLSFLLAYCETDSTEKAQQLLSHHGNLANLLDAKSENMDAFPILSENGDLLLRLVAELHRRYLLIRSRMELRLLDRASVAEYFIPLFSNTSDEAVFLLSMDDSRRVIDCSLLAKGELHSAHLPVRSLVKEALMKKASTVILAHNHPAGPLLPSKEDIQSTLTLKELLSPLGIVLSDHMIFNDSGYCSLVECGYYQP